MVVACTTAECDAIHNQFRTGSTLGSSLFSRGLVCPDSVPAGLFVRCIVEILKKFNAQPVRQESNVVMNCVSALQCLKPTTCATVTSYWSEPHAFDDPRETLFEVWLQAMTELTYATASNIAAETLLVDTLQTAISLIFCKKTKNDSSGRANEVGMSLDGPQSLALISFAEAFFRLGPDILKEAGRQLMNTFPVDIGLLQSTSSETIFYGLSVFGAALFRCFQGALPPWTIESVPDLYKSLMRALGCDSDAFGLMLLLSMEARLVQSKSFGGVAGGELLSGHCFEDLSRTAKSCFIAEVQELSKTGTDADWRKIKGLVKQICGGKKKDTDFKQKPSLTRWVFERV
jgi:hypothetical protein